MSDERRKRSRFDQTEPEPSRKSRFDRRSRSPAREESEAHRSRSPVSRSLDSVDGVGDSAKKDAAAAAAAAAARINESINAKKNVQQVDVPPILTSASPGGGDAGSAKSPSQAPLTDEIYQQDGDYIKDIEVNDLRNRYTLTKGSTQKMIKEKTGADVTTRGSYFPDKSMATPANPPLYLHVTSTTKDGLERAVQEIEELMKHELPNLIDERRFRRREPEQVERDSLGRRKWPEERIPIDLEPIPGFNLRAQVVGAGGSYVKHIQQETRCRVQIKGRGSGFMEHDTGRESDEQMYLHVAGPDANDVELAKNLCIDLLKNVRQSYDEFKERGPRSGGNRGGAPDDSRGGYHQRERNGGSGSYGGNGHQYGYSQQQQQQQYSGGAQSPQSVQAQVQPQQQQQQQQGYVDPTQVAAWVAYYAANPEADPYAQYGGYGAVMGPYLQTQQVGAPGYQGYAGSPTQQYHFGMDGTTEQPPPPPDAGESASPPPPPPPPPGA